MMSDTPLARYERDLQRDGFQRDEAQASAVAHLEDLYQRLLTSKGSTSSTGVLGKLQMMLGRSSSMQPEKGLYFWGGVGRGKTYLVDNFFDALPFEQKMRTHFHRFMRRVHQELTRLKGEKNPLEQVADTIAAEARVLCFDEFFVVDITDAMILATLLEALFKRGVTLVATSNIPPEKLYENGLQRARFLPAIALIQQHTQVVNVDGGTDYRLRTLQQAEVFYIGSTENTDKRLQDAFERLAPVGVKREQGVDLTVEGRVIHARHRCDDVALFDFAELCDGPRSQNDYIELAREFHAVLLARVPQLHGEQDDQTRRFINLVDEFYDRRVKLIIGSEASLKDLYVGTQMQFPFQRTVSRLLEMQSEEYLASPHRSE